MTNKKPQLECANSNTFSDEELILKFRKGDQKALTELYLRYQNIARVSGKYESKNFKAPGLTNDDYVTLFMESFYKALSTFDTTKGAFRSYWRTISHNEILKMLAENNKYYGHVAYSLDMDFDEDRELRYEDIVGEVEENPLYDEDDSSIGLYVAEYGIKLLDPIEEEVITSRMFGESYPSIAKKLNISIGDARYYFLTAKEKLKKSNKINAFIKKHYYKS